MEPLTPLDERSRHGWERSRHDWDRDPTVPGRGAMIALLVVATLVALAVFALGGVGGELEDPFLPTPIHVPGS